MASVSAENPYVESPSTDFAPVEELDAEEAREQAEQLREAIRYHDYRYYVENDPVIADRTYDVLFSRLQDLEAAFDVRTDDSPTRRVGGEPVEELGTVEHVAPMLSIDSSGDPADVRARDVMTPDPVTADRDLGVFELTRLMVEHSTRRVPVVDGDELYGIVTLDDLARLFAEEQWNLASVIEAESPPLP